METAGIGLAFILLAGLLVSIYIRVQKDKKELRSIQEESISYTTHQLRSPITAVRGYASLLLDEEYGSLSEDLRRPIDIIRRSSEQLAVVIEEYREFGRLERGEVELNYELIPIGLFVRDVVEEIQPEVEERNHSIFLEVEDLPESRIDRSRVRQVLHNIIENSISYTPVGTEIYVHAYEENGKILITISDNGPGIPEEEIEAIFEKYKRGKYGLASGAGTGLGLYIARAIIRSHGGDIRAMRSEKYGGAAFQVEIPILL